jgi:cyclic-di-GMP phosphodiesterase TipF (flagellum assembly factor)
MLRLTAIFIAICVVVIAASFGAVGYLVFGLSGMEASLLALAAMSGLALYNTVTARLHDRDHVGKQIADLSRGTADLARQVAEMTRRQIAIEHQEAARRAPGPNEALAAEIGELGGLLKQLAETIADHETRLTELQEEPSAILAALAAASPGPADVEIPKVAAAPQEEAPRPQAGTAYLGSAQSSPAAQPVRPQTDTLTAAGPFKGKKHDEIADIIRSAIDENRVDLYLQPVLTLPQRKVRYYEAMTRLRMNDGTLILPSDFMADAEKANLIARIDNVQLFRCVQVLRRLLLQNREIGLFCNVSVPTLNDTDVFRQFYDFLEANRALTASLTLEFTQDALRSMGPLEQESLASLSSLGYRFSMDRVTDLRMGPRDLAELGVRFVKVPANLLLSKGASSSDIHAADLSDLLGRHGISLIAERIETEATVIDLLDYDVRFGQGFLFSAPRPVRAEALQTGPAQRPDPVSVAGGSTADRRSASPPAMGGLAAHASM